MREQLSALLATRSATSTTATASATGPTVTFLGSGIIEESNKSSGSNKRIGDDEALDVVFESPETKMLTTIVFTQRPLGITFDRAVPIGVSHVTPAGHAAGVRPRMILRSFNGQDASEAGSYDAFVACVSSLPVSATGPTATSFDFGISVGTCNIGALVIHQDGAAADFLVFLVPPASIPANADERLRVFGEALRMI